MKILLWLIALSGIVSCAQLKETGQDIGHTTRDVTRTIGHTARDVTRDVGHASRDAVKSVKEELQQD